MKIKSAEFLKSCTAAEQFPQFEYPEFAFFGRSNVGKSSLLNMLLGKKDLVKTGSRPGVTTMINFFIVNDNKSFVDLPGFGYAKLPAPMRKKFMPLIKEYVQNRENLKLAFMLVDIRRTPGDYEEEIIAFLTDRKIPVAITITKADKLSKNQRAKRIKEIETSLGISSDSIFLSSATTGEGKRELLNLITDMIQTSS
jgi:GTP-binding protein